MTMNQEKITASEPVDVLEERGRLILQTLEGYFPDTSFKVPPIGRNSPQYDLKETERAIIEAVQGIESRVIPVRC